MQYRFDTPPENPSKPSTPAKRPAAKKVRKTRKKHPFLKVLFYLFSIGLIASLFIGTYVVIHAVQFVGGEKAIVLEDYKFQQAKTTIIYAYKDASKKQTVEVARLHGEENRIWVPLSSVPDDLKNAFIALEDKRFYDHHGVDWIRTIGSATKYKMSQGGSTLTQQLIKNLTNEKDVTIIRKLNEILTALNLERHYSKNDVLETYLNTAYMGNGCYGIQTASETYFGKNVGELDLAECAVLATITNEPTTYDPLLNPNNTKTRQELCLKQMLEQGKISQEQYDKAIKEKLIYTNSKDYKPKTSTSAPITGREQITSSFVDYVIDQVISDLKKEHNYTSSQAFNALYYKGLKIYTTMNVEAQKAAEEVFLNKTGVPAVDAKQGVQASMTMMDYEGHIVAMVGQLGKKTGSRSLNRATTLRNPGSTFKPLATYTPAIENNLVYWSKLYLDQNLVLQDGSKFPHNYNGRYGSGKYVTVQYALRESLNTVPARIIMYDLGMEKSFNWLTQNLHFTTLTETNRYSLSSLAIGGGADVSTVEMCAAYATIGNSGKYYRPYCYYKVVQTKEDEDIILLQNKSEAEQAMKPETAELTRRILQTINRGPYKLNSTLAKNLSYMKTGTTDGHKDRWFALGFPQYIAVSWYGYDKQKTTYDNHVYNPAGYLSFQTFNKIASTLPKTEFKNTGNLVQKAYCTQTGLLASSSCPNKGTGWYIKSNLPGTCTAHNKSLVDTIVDAITN
ncbi:MAG: penicillin-binding protein [Oscillospiraceae bacterium]|jgi:penicillin-binding protein 1A|nr:penicillin-binding protein [Oscillospiraceae bacterium]